jgi:cytochrome P450
LHITPADSLARDHAKSRSLKATIVETVDADLFHGSPVLARPIPPATPLPFLQYIRTMRDNAIAAFHDDIFHQPLSEIKYFKLHTFLVNDPAGIKHVLIDNAANYIKGGVEQRTLGAWPIKGFAAQDGEEWRQRRRTMSSSFDYPSILENSASIVDAAQRVLGRWTALPPLTVIEVHAEMARLTLAIISRIVFSADSAEFARIMELTSRRYQGDRIVDPLDFAPILDRAWKVYKGYRQRYIFKDLNASIDRLIVRRNGRATRSENDFLGRLLERKDPQTGSGLSTQELHSQIITILGTGHETAALALMWTWYLLSQHPLEEAMLHAELDEVLAGRTPAFADLARLPYTRMVVEEALRLYPPTHTMPWRGALRDDEVCGVRIPKGATVSIVPWVLHRHSKLWDHPEQFDPERFSPDRSGGRSRFAYLPFGIGPRVCIGASFAMTEIMLILAALAQRYRLRLVPGHKVEPWGLVSLKARYGMKMTLQSRPPAPSI